jgi:hypothetical protein
MRRAIFASCPQLAMRLMAEAPHLSMRKPLATKAEQARLPPAHQAPPLKILASPLRLRQRVVKKIASVLKSKRRRRRRRRTPTVATAV